MKVKLSTSSQYAGSEFQYPMLFIPILQSIGEFFQVRRILFRMGLSVMIIIGISGCSFFENSDLQGFKPDVAIGIRFEIETLLYKEAVDKTQSRAGTESLDKIAAIPSAYRNRIQMSIAQDGTYQLECWVLKPKAYPEKSYESLNPRDPKEKIMKHFVIKNEKVSMYAEDGTLIRELPYKTPNYKPLVDYINSKECYKQNPQAIFNLFYPLSVDGSYYLDKCMQQALKEEGAKVTYADGAMLIERSIYYLDRMNRQAKEIYPRFRINTDGAGMRTTEDGEEPFVKTDTMKQVEENILEASSQLADDLLDAKVVTAVDTTDKTIKTVYTVASNNESLMSLTHFKHDEEKQVEYAEFKSMQKDPVSLTQFKFVKLDHYEDVNVTFNPQN